MPERLKILLLEDSPDDAGLIKREIARGGIPATIYVVSSKAEFEKALDELVPDAILCDHSIPGFNSFGALDLYKEFQEKHNRRIPFLLVTGTLTDEFASFCLQAGAHDYILKDHMKRLPGALQNALERCRMESERAAYLSEIIAYESSMKEAEAVARFGTWKSWLDSGRAIWSDGSFRLFGYEWGEVKPGFDLFMKHVHPDDRQRVQNEIEKVRAGQTFNEFEHRIITKQGILKRIFNRIRLQKGNGQSDFLLGFIFEIPDNEGQ